MTRWRRRIAGDLDILVLTIAAVLAMMALASCGTRTSSSTAEVERTIGTQAGQPVDLTTTRRSQSEAATAVDIGPLVQAAVAAATGDIRAGLAALTQRPAPASADDLAQAVARVMPDDAIISPEAAGAGTAAALAALIAWLKAREAGRLRADNDDAWERLASRDAPRPEPRPHR